MIKIILSLLICLPIASFSQKISHNDKTNAVTVDGVYALKIERIGCGFGMTDCHYDVFDTTGAKVIRVNYRDFKSFVQRNASNPEGIVRYFEFIFLASKTKAEIEFMGIKEEKLAKSIVKNNLIAGGKLNDKAVEEFVLVHGTSFSDKSRY
jgi:hypothetical protein